MDTSFFSPYKKDDPNRVLSIPDMDEKYVSGLRKAKIQQVEELCYANLSLLSSQSGAPIQELQNFLDNTTQSLVPQMLNGMYVWDDYAELGIQFSTGIQNLDQQLNGGLLSGNLVELVGEPATGKTQLCLTASALALKQQNCTIAYIDSSNSFSASRLLEIYFSRFCDEKDVNMQQDLKKLKYYSVFDIFQFMDLLQVLQTQMEPPITPNDSQPSGRLQLVIVDSFAALISPLLVTHGKSKGLRSFGFGQYLLSYVCKWMKSLAMKYQVLFLVTNTMVSGEDGKQKKPALGELWSFQPNQQIYLTNFSNERALYLSKATQQASNTKIPFQIGENGMSSPSS